jgi:hypothetical protein
MKSNNGMALKARGDELLALKAMLLGSNNRTSACYVSMCAFATFPISLRDMGHIR